ncbi:MFS transporter [Cellulomonas aerilata]|uniref:MFS transporter n=1 Tax=Cellulomonas aerilata TaxID=515326 RepID=A0A512D8X3_9CELL|nr:MFS transporter [Cellulomonas aerilata]
MRHDRTVLEVVDGPRLARARWALMGLFMLSGLMFSSWLARLPSVRDALGMSPSELGAVLLAGAVGALLAVTVAGAVVTRWGGRVSLVLSSVGFAVAFVLLGLGPAVGSVPILAVGVFLNGVSFAIGNVPLNVESAGVERRLGRTVLPHFHAAFSVGAVLGSLLGAAMAQLEVGLLAQFVGTGVVGLVWRLASVPHVVLDTAPVVRSAPHGGTSDDVVAVGPRGGGLRTALGAWRERRTVLIGFVIMSAALSEGSANDWLALAVVDGFGRTEAVGAIVFGVFVSAMTLVRILGTRLIDRFGRVLVLRVSGLVSMAGLLVFGFAPSLAIAVAGVVAWGLGAALAVPIGLAAASDDPLRAAGRVSVVSAFSSIAHLAAPPLLGLAAEHVGARHALLLITAAMVVSVLLSREVERPVDQPLDRPDAAPGGARPGSPSADAGEPVPVGVGETDVLPAEGVLVPTRRGAPA